MVKTSTTYIFAIRLCKPLIFQIIIIWSNTIQSLNYQRFTTLGCEDKEIRVLEFVAKTQILYTIFTFELRQNRQIVYNIITNNNIFETQASTFPDPGVGSSRSLFFSLFCHFTKDLARSSFLCLNSRYSRDLEYFFIVKCQN